MPAVDILLPGLAAAGLTGGRLLARARRVYVRLMVEPYRGDRTRPEALLAAIAGLQSVVAVRGPRRVWGQPSVALEVHLHVRAGGAPLAWLAVCVPRGLERQAQAALRASYPNCALRPVGATVQAGALVRLHKRSLFTNPVRRLEDIDPDRPPVERLLRAMAAAGGASVVQLALTPAPAALGWTRAGAQARPDTGADTDFSERPARGRGPWFYADVRVVGQERRQVAVVAAELRAGGAANRLVGRRVGLLGRWWVGRRVGRGEGDPMPGLPRRSYAAEEIAGLWQLPSVGFAGVPLGRRAVPVAPAPAGILRVSGKGGLLADEHGRVTIHAELRRQNTAVVGTVEQGKTSYLVASVREDLEREDCAVIVLDPKGDAADAAVSVVPPERVCTLLDLGRPTCGFNPLSVQAPIDAIADFVVAAVRQLFGEGEVKGSSDRYLRNALIGALAYDRRASLWDVARLLEVGPGGVALRARVAHHLTALPEFAEVASFLADELPGQLADARASTTAKLDAPANKLARVLNSASVKRVLLNTSLTIDFDRVIAEREVLIVRGALGEVGAGNVSVLMQLLVGMLDAALSRAQDRRRGDRAPVAVALKVDEAPLVINGAFAQTMALKRSAGLETVACWQADAQWPEELRQQLDALFAHRVLFATASADDARAAAGLLMAEFSDQLRTGDQAVATLAAPDVRLHLPRHTAIASWGTPGGRERPFIGRTLRLSVDPDRLADQAEQQRRRGGRELENLAPPPRLDQLPPATDQPPPAPDRVSPAGNRMPPTTDQSPSAADELSPAADGLAPATDGLSPTAAELPEATDGLRPVAAMVPAATGEVPLAADRLPPATGPISSAAGVQCPGHPSAGRALEPAGTGASVPARSRLGGTPDVGDVPGGSPLIDAREARRVDKAASRLGWRQAPSSGSVAAPPSEAPVAGSSGVRAESEGSTQGASGVSSTTASAGAGSMSTAAGAPAQAIATRTPTGSTAPTFLELRAVDAARAVRWLPVPPGVRTRTLDPAELELLGWIAAAGCALSSQIHRRMSPGRALTTTQRRLKRLADAGLIARFQLHGGDGGGVPFCCAITTAGLALLDLPGRIGPVVADETLDGLRRDVHTVGWLLALEAYVGVLSVLGPGRARLAPGDAGIADVVGLEAGLHPRDFLVGDPEAGPRRAVERFRPLTPAGVAELSGATDLLVFHEPTGRARSVALVERLDHLISGWWRAVPRYARRGQPPAAVVVCADDVRARALAQVADGVLTACLARIGQPPDEWEYPGRRGIAFVAESDIHDGRLAGWQVPPVAAPFRPDWSNCTRRDPALDLLPAIPGRPLPRWR